MDDSDTEWEEHVRTQHGVRGYNRGDAATALMDVDIDIDGLVRDMAQTYEDVKEAAWENRESCPNMTVTANATSKMQRLLKWSKFCMVETKKTVSGGIHDYKWISMHLTTRTGHPYTPVPDSPV